MAAVKPQAMVYKVVGNLEISLDLYLPPEAENVPILLWFHGRGMLQYHRNMVPPHMVWGVTKYNYALVSADYRLAPQVSIEEIFEDVKNCVSFVRKEVSWHVHSHDSIDPSRLLVSGSSAGGYLALLAGLYIEPKPTALMPIYPITDPLGQFFLTPHPEPDGGRVELETVAEYLNPAASVVTNSEVRAKTGRSRMYNRMLQDASLAALLHIPDGADGNGWRIPKNIRRCGLPPSYFVQPEEDRDVGPEQCDEVVGIMAGLGIEVEYERIPRLAHGFDHDESVELERMYEFLVKHV